MKPTYKLDVDDETLDIIADFGQCIEDNNLTGVSFYDEKFLPHPKDAIFKALAKGINAAPNQETLEALKISITMLPSFQNGVGPIPVEFLPSKMVQEGLDFSNMTDKDIVDHAKKIAEYSEKNKKKFERLQQKYDEELLGYCEVLGNDRLSQMIKNSIASREV